MEKCSEQGLSERAERAEEALLAEKVCSRQGRAVLYVLSINGFCRRKVELPLPAYLRLQGFTRSIMSISRCVKCGLGGNDSRIVARISTNGSEFPGSFNLRVTTMINLHWRAFTLEVVERQAGLI